MKRIASSRLAMVTAISLCASTLSMVALFLTTVRSEAMGAVLETLDIFAIIYGDGLGLLAGIFIGIMLGVSIAMMVLPFLKIIGLLMTAVSARKAGGKFITSGVSLTRGVYVAELVIFGIFGTITCLFLLLTTPLIFSDLGYTFRDITFGDVSYILTVIVEVGLIVFYYVMVIRSLDAEKEAIENENGYVTKNVSAFVGVITFVYGVMPLFSLIPSLVMFAVPFFGFMPSELGDFYLESLLAALFTAAGYICFGILIFKLRGELKPFVKKKEKKAKRDTGELNNESNPYSEK